MAELTPIEQKIVAALKELGAVSEDKLKTADHVQKQCKLPKGQVNSALMSLVSKGYVKRVAREKVSGYYLVKSE
jgi:DNA-binding IclR family transcriptional regulator